MANTHDVERIKDLHHLTIATSKRLCDFAELLLQLNLDATGCLSLTDAPPAPADVAHALLKTKSSLASWLRQVDAYLQHAGVTLPTP